jgi:hypothetical protein
MPIRFIACCVLILGVTDATSAGYLTLRAIATDFDRPFSGIPILLAESNTGLLDFDMTNMAGTRFVDAWGEIANGTIRLRLHNRSGLTSLRGSVKDQYVLAGPTGGTVTLTAYLEVDGFTSYLGTGTRTRVLGEIGADFQEDGFGGTFPTFNEIGSSTGSVNTDVEFTHDFAVPYTFNATVGVPFQLAYSVVIGNGGPTLAPGSVLTDLTNTATVRFELPEGFSLTSQNRFGAPTADSNSEVPEPGSMTLLGCGIASMCWFGRHRRKPAVSLS